MGARKGRGRRARGPGGLHAHLGEGGGHIWAPPEPPPPEPTHGCCPPASSRIPPPHVAPATAAHGACRGWDGARNSWEGSPNPPGHPWDPPLRSPEPPSPSPPSPAPTGDRGRPGDPKAWGRDGGWGGGPQIFFFGRGGPRAPLGLPLDTVGPPERLGAPLSPPSPSPPRPAPTRGRGRPGGPKAGGGVGVLGGPQNLGGEWGRSQSTRGTPQDRLKALGAPPNLQVSPKFSLRAPHSSRQQG